MTQSMSRVACCLDNGPTEGLWEIIKTEMYKIYDIHNKESWWKQLANTSISIIINVIKRDLIQKHQWK